MLYSNLREWKRALNTAKIIEALNATYMLFLSQFNFVNGNIILYYYFARTNF